MSSKRRAVKPSGAPTTVPTPFSKAPASLRPFLERLDPAHVHLTHIDRHPAAHKRAIFAIPVVLNLCIGAVLLWRLATATPVYYALVLTVLGFPTGLRVDAATTPRRAQLGLLLRRFAMMAGDFLLFRVVGPWPVTFFAEQPANPCVWRWRLGFRAAEAVVRVSRGWGTDDLMRGVRQGQDNAFFHTRILPAIDPAGVMRKTGYLMMGKDWDLDFELMLDAHTLAERRDIALEDLDRLVLAFQDGVGWIAWRWETVAPGGVDVIEARRKKVVLFKERLTASGKESLFWRWMEIVEEERDADGGFTPDGQQKVARRVQEEFEKNGVDFDELVKSIGGLEDMAAPSR